MKHLVTKSFPSLTPGSSSETNTVTFTINDEVAPLSIPDDVPEFHKKPNINKDKTSDSDGIGPAYTIDGPKKKYHQVSFTILATFYVFTFCINCCSEMKVPKKVNVHVATGLVGTRTFAF